MSSFRLRQPPSGGAIAIAVLVTVASLLAAAFYAPQAEPERAEPQVITPQERQFVCGSPIDHTRIFSAADVAQEQSQTRLREDPTVVTYSGEQVNLAYAAQASRGDPPAAWLACPEAQASWHFVGLGATHSRRGMLEIYNPQAGVAIVDVEVAGEQGLIETAELKAITVEPDNLVRVNLAQAAPSTGEVSVRLRARRGLVTAIAVDRRGADVRETGQPTWVMPQRRPATEAVIVGLPHRPEQAELLIANLRQRETQAAVELLGPDGPYVPQGLEQIVVPARSTVTVPITKQLRQADVSAVVRADQPLLSAVRARVGGSHQVLAAVGNLPHLTSVGLPGGGGGKLTVATLAKTASVRVSGFTAEGKEVMQEKVELAGPTSATLPLPQRVRQIRFEDGTATYVGWSYQRGGDWIGRGVEGADTQLRVPVVRYGW